MPNLLFCMTPGIGLGTWEKIGSLQRELKPYEEYIRRGWNVKILTYDKNPVPELPKGIETIRFPNKKLLWLLPWTHRKLGAWADLIKTNQSHHAFFYVRAANKWNKPILLRCGYVHGEYLETIDGKTPKTRLYQWLEAKAFRNAGHCQVPTSYLSKWIANKYNVPDDKISVIPNSVETCTFKPIAGARKKDRSIVSVGRLNKVKRFDMLINACAKIPGSELTLIGEGPEKQRLSKMAKEVGLKLNLPGNVPHESLPEILQEHIVFAITSKREGHPKALIEAMACGMPCLGVDVIGIQNIIEDGKNGLLVSGSQKSVTEGLSILLEDIEMRERLSMKAREYAKKHYDSDKCLSMEHALVERLIKR
ncbi:MAG TPA: glycosyltransferase family 1 protein [Nitrospirae bacterium]|nr:glycosyltransferase family 1 protein [Nitrospirota bacterium]